MCSAEKSKLMQDTIEMQTEVSNMKQHTEHKAPLWKRVMWLVIIYGASVLALGVVASLFRMMMTAAGMRSH
ncbi:MAG: hypothetical protein K0S95_3190 [Pantoea eucrina]|jgi:hypothetical protein|nr:hypothetical protein [Pantoea eucrina]